MPVCHNCNETFPNYLTIDGKKRNLCNRKYCLDCSPFKVHNTRPLRTDPLKVGKICPRCGKFLGPEHFYRRRKSRQLSTYCKDCTRLQTTERQRRLKAQAVEYLGGKCSRCGYNRNLAALDFHHPDPAQKDFTIARSHLYSFERIKPELNRCLLLCANCHREIHAEQTS